MSDFSLDSIAQWTDVYFLKTKEMILRFGDARVTYALFLRCPVLSAPRLCIAWLEEVARQRDTRFEIEVNYPEGQWVGAGEPIMYLTGPFSQLVDLETLMLMKLGATCVAAQNAFTMCAYLPGVKFLAMDARHCAGTEMAEMMAYAASVGSQRAKEKVGALGFIGNATHATAPYFDQRYGMGTMPHALIGYAGSTVRAAEMFHETFPDQDLTVLVDYFGLEITDSLASCRRFPMLAQEGRLSIRLDTPGSRFIESLDPAGSYAVLERHVPESIRSYRSESDLRYLIGTGVSAAAIYHLRDHLNDAGFPKVKIIASSEFNPDKCRMMKEARAPIDIIGTGSYLPRNWNETYTTADIIAYDGVKRVKLGREFLFPKRHDTIKTSKAD